MTVGRRDGNVVGIEEGDVVGLLVGDLLVGNGVGSVVG